MFAMGFQNGESLINIIIGTIHDLIKSIYSSLFSNDEVSYNSLIPQGQTIQRKVTIFSNLVDD